MVLVSHIDIVIGVGVSVDIESIFGVVVSVGCKNRCLVLVQVSDIYFDFWFWC